MVTETVEKYRDVYAVASQLYERNPDWATFFREVLGVGGVVRKSFTDANELAEFKRSEEFGMIQDMLEKLRAKKGSQAPVDEPTKVITVRLPQSLHEALQDEAHQHRVSMNKLCISKLLKIIEQQIANEQAG